MHSLLVAVDAPEQVRSPGGTWRGGKECQAQASAACQPEPPPARQDEQPVAALVALTQRLEGARFRDFWAALDACRDVVADVAGFTEAVRPARRRASDGGAAADTSSSLTPLGSCCRDRLGARVPPACSCCAGLRAPVADRRPASLTVSKCCWRRAPLARRGAEGATRRASWKSVPQGQWQRPPAARCGASRWTRSATPAGA